MKFSEKRFRLCSPSEMPLYDLKKEDHFGKVCWKYCSKKAFWSKKCKIWETEIYDLLDKEVFTRFLNAGFVIIKEDRIN